MKKKPKRETVFGLDKMATVKCFKNMNSDLSAIFEDIIMELEKEKELNIVNRLEEETEDGNPFLSVTAVRVGTPGYTYGETRELSVTITGTPNDYIVEVHAGCWGFDYSGAEGLKTSGPDFGLPSSAYLHDLLRRIDELVRKHSEKDLGFDNVETITE
ncbi:hypothetical protein AKJ56_02140 [candidate division MSBL1 archaeon SCGC-AAA382N08]|uniref:Uncharacterized protein n=1 Tax=candidate division MSBL1 archaeon SCGC-AAA382N08 TaxID=1698285 RepID=A0A133VNC6_9EURY|nr:hypothetical protein AKJ56_02140 [candidate division MSBL1 archaeon SCGC-AAA382N08]